MGPKSQGSQFSSVRGTGSGTRYTTLKELGTWGIYSRYVFLVRGTL